MKCPFCEEAPPTEEELEAHITIRHPEKAEMFNILNQVKAMQKLEVGRSQRELYSLAATLTQAAIGTGGVTGEIVLERFRYFVKELYSIFREDGV